MPASVVEERVAFILEAKLNGVEHLERLRSRCGRDGSYSLEIAFERGTEPNLAQMLVQNRVNDAMPLLPEEVRRLGVTVRQASSVLVMLLTLSSSDKSADISSDLNNFASVYFRPQLARMRGVAEVNLHGRDGMSARILLDPQKLTAHQLTVPDVKRAIEQQALEATSGPRGGFQFTPNARGGLKVDQLASIAIKSDPNGAAIRIDDVKSIIQSGEDLVGFASLDGNSVAVLEVYALAGADPHAVSAAVRDQLPELRESLPPGLELSGYARSKSSGYPIEFALRGFDRQPLRELANTIVAQMSRDPRLTDAWAGPRPVPTYAVDIDRAKVARLGLALPDVSASLQAVFGTVQAGNVQVVSREWPILLKIDPAGRSEVERLVQSHLRTAKGDLISLSEVAAVHLESEPAYLERLNIYPVIVITAGLGGDLSLAEARFVCERLVTDAIRERGRAANPLRWLRPMPPAKAPARSGGAPDRAGGP